MSTIRRPFSPQGFSMQRKSIITDIIYTIVNN
jgi:hypothetical protein